MSDYEKYKDDWKQMEVVRCPDVECRGLLLQNPYLHEMKCSKCGKLWLEISDWVDVTDRLE